MEPHPIRASTKIISYIACSEIRAFEFSELRSTLELGEVPFNSAPIIALHNRLRRRTWIEPDAVPYLDTQAKVDDMAEIILRERYKAFEPVSVIGVRPDCLIRLTVSVTD